MKPGRGDEGRAWWWSQGVEERIAPTLMANILSCCSWGSLEAYVGDWSSGMIPASGAGGREFDSRITPTFVFLYNFSLRSHHGLRLWLKCDAVTTNRRSHNTLKCRNQMYLKHKRHTRNSRVWEKGVAQPHPKYIKYKYTVIKREHAWRE